MAEPLNHSAQQLLLLVARERLSPDQQARAIALAAGVNDWDAFLRVTARTLGMCLAYACLSKLEAAPVPAQVLAAMRDGARLQAAHALMIEATYRDFAARCLAPTQAEHVFFKGPALAMRYYGTPSHRPCRDVDLLVESGAVLDVVRQALACGYVPYGVDALRDDRDVAAWVRYGSVFPMRAPTGALVEIHKSLDHGEGVFDTRALLDRSEVFDLRELQIRVLRTADLFTYICMHHTRHFWSHLHWFGDLDAIRRHSDFDLDEVRATAARAGLLSTVDACLGLDRLAAGADWASNGTGAGAEHTLLAGALTCLLGGRASEDALRGTRLSLDRAHGWQLSPSERAFNRLRWIGRKLRPSHTDYRALPLPAALQGLYWFTRPFRVIGLALGGRLHRDRGAAGAAGPTGQH